MLIESDEGAKTEKMNTPRHQKWCLICGTQCVEAATPAQQICGAQIIEMAISSLDSTAHPRLTLIGALDKAEMYI
jgi:hypothetical protein